jgi:hypothetical protein
MSITRLQKTLTRRIGDLVVSIGPEGLRVRLPRRRRSTMVTWQWLLERLPVVADSRREAFLAPLPPGWRPQAGDWVWVRPILGTMARQVSRGQVRAVLPGMGEEMIRVRLRYARGNADCDFALSNVRPAPGPPHRSGDPGPQPLIDAPEP